MAARRYDTYRMRTDVFCHSQKFEPLLLLPISFGMLLANLPLAGLMGAPMEKKRADYCIICIKVLNSAFIRR